MDQHYHIIGGGIGGMCTAIALQKNNRPYTLYEKVYEITYEKLGLGISRNVFPVLQEWGVLEKILEIGSEVRKMVFVNRKMKTLRGLRLKHPALSVDRSELYEVLAGKLEPEKVKLNTAPTAEDFPGEEVVIAADGMHSGTRRKIYPNLRLRRSGQVLWRGIAHVPLDKTFHNTYYDFIGGNQRFAIIHTGGDQYSWYLVKEGKFKGEEEVPDVKQMCRDFLEDYAPVAREVVAGTEKIYRSELTDMDPAERNDVKWYSGNLAFIGDAIHPVTPNMANGACLAMEDAYVLTTLLNRYGTNIYTAFKVYQHLRERKVNSIVIRSWALGQMMHQNNKLMDLLMLAGTRLIPQWAFDQIYAGVLNDESLKKVKEMQVPC